MLYHTDIYLPVGLNDYLGNYRLVYTRHAQLECIKDRYKVIIPPKEVTITMSNIIEVEKEGEEVKKILIRVKYDNDFDLMLAIIPTGIIGTVKTVWLNSVKDNHKTLDRSKYFPNKI